MPSVFWNIFWSLFLFITTAQAEIKVYQDTDNTGTNKFERIGIIEKYLIDLSQSLKTMEVKIDANALKLKTLEDVVSQIKEKDLKNIQAQLAEKKPAAKKEASSEGELEKLKADILTLKNDDIEKMKIDLDLLNRAVKKLEK